MNPHWSLYILRCQDGSLYTGITTDLVARVAKHNAGTGAKYTRGRGPVELVWSRKMKTGTEARKREVEIKMHVIHGYGLKTVKMDEV